MRRIELVSVVTFSLLVAILVGYVTYFAEQFNEPSDDEIIIDLAVNFLRTNPTFVFDGIEQSLKVGPVISTLDEPPSIFRLSINFTSEHPGYGDRSGQILAEAMSDHQIDITIGRVGISDQFLVQSAEIDGVWNELTQTGFSLAANQLLGPEWILVSFLYANEELQLDIQNNITIVFSTDGSVSGFGGCNRYFGPFEARGNSLNVGLLASTRMGCPGVGEIETVYLGIFAEQLSFQVTFEGLRISSFDSENLLLFIRE